MHMLWRMSSFEGVADWRYICFALCRLCLLQNLLSLLQHLASQQQASRLPNLTAPDALQAAEMLATAAQQPEQLEQLQQQADSKQQQVKQHPGVQFLCQWLARVLPELEAAQQLQLLDCLAAVAQAGLGEHQQQHLCMCI
jgi:hypothetical protein